MECVIIINCDPCSLLESSGERLLVNQELISMFWKCLIDKGFKKLQNSCKLLFSAKMSRNTTFALSHNLCLSKQILRYISSPIQIKFSASYRYFQSNGLHEVSKPDNSGTQSFRAPDCLHYSQSTSSLIHHIVSNTLFTPP